jgi:hypothetical protein
MPVASDVRLMYAMEKARIGRRALRKSLEIEGESGLNSPRKA